MAETKVDTDIETLKADFSQLRTDLRNLTRTIGEISARRAEEGTESLKQVGGRAAERLRAVASDANSFKDAGLAAAERQITEHPVSSLLVAFAAGLVIGKLVDRR